MNMKNETFVTKAAGGADVQVIRAFRRELHFDAEPRVILM